MTLEIHSILSAYLEELRASTNEELEREGGEGEGEGERSAGRQGQGKDAGGRPPPLSFMVNFPLYRANPGALHRAAVVHLDSAINDMRQIQSVLRALALLVLREDFAGRLDVENENVIPFANGVLDVQHLVLRPGRPEDLVMRGPTYAWRDYPAGDASVVELEHILTTLFPDRSIRDFMLDVGASLLRKRNRHKHFYILTGNTNGGKSLYLSLLKHAFGTLYGVLPLAALTGRQGDPSSHNDYLARTQGFCLCVANEPDSATQHIYPDAAKVLTSDSDRIIVRELYGSSREMVITTRGALAAWPVLSGDRGSCSWRATRPPYLPTWTPPWWHGVNTSPLSRPLRMPPRRTLQPSLPRYSSPRTGSSTRTATRC